MRTSPFDDEDGRFFVVVNDEGQHALWPATLTTIPDGWTVAYGEETRQACLDYVNEHWTDLRPRSVREQLDRQAAGR
ncbi:MbtH family protein [Lentzea sp. PSKA42]|uniref:MbtH family protein n=1 Tax=Lentzea indica TaxID=2604800 RepID=A0ABX1FM72_9PSEU|nr:MbtH family protein [Lentzea indica]NKE60089.1 MbtH family protein [Lentzea indica]